MKFLVTGCAGFIGSNLTERLINEGHVVDGVDDLSNGHTVFLPHGIRAFYQSDFSDTPIIANVRRQNYDVVLHIAAVPRVSYSVEHPIETNDVNVSRTLKLITAARGNVKRVVFASSSSVYGGADVLPTPETYRKDPKSPYALQKSMIEDYLLLYKRLYGLDSACLRFFNVFGKNQLGNSPYATAVSAWLTAIKSGSPMRSDGDGSQSRDMCHVDNVVDACIRAATHPDELGAECFNVACGDRVTNKEILEFLKARYPNATSVDAPWRAGDVMHTQADVSKVEKVLGYKPLVKFWDGLERTIRWYDESWDKVKGLKLRT